MKFELSKFKKWAFLLLLIPFISIIIVIIFRHSYFPTNEEIIEEVKNAENYTSKVEYQRKNQKLLNVELAANLSKINSNLPVAYWVRK